MKGLTRRIREWAYSVSRSLLAAAIAGIKGFSAARTSIKFLLGILLLMVPAGILLSRSLVQAVPPSMIIVTSLEDDAGAVAGNGYCTLREAINNANSPGTDTTEGDCDVPPVSTPVEITFLFDGTIMLSSALPQIASPVNLTVNGAPSVIIDGMNSYQVFNVASGATLTLTNLHIEDGSATNGGAVNNSGTLSVTSSTFLANVATNGAAIYSNGTSLTVSSANFDNNSASTTGGAIYDNDLLMITGSSFGSAGGNGAAEGGAVFLNNGGTIGTSIFSLNTAAAEGGALFLTNGATITNSAFTGNSQTTYGVGDDGGGAIYATGGTTTVTGTTFSNNNSASSNGGAIYVDNSLSLTAATLNITNSTFSGNTASFSGGAIVTNGNPTVSLVNSTVSGNTASGGFFGGGVCNSASTGTFTVTNTILSANTGGAGTGNCAGTITNGGYNISDDASCSFGTSTGANGQTIGDSVTPDLGPLASNGGPTQTFALLPNSPAIDAVPLADSCPATDQRGFPRPDPEDAGTACDIGAYESSPAIIVNTVSDMDSAGFCNLREAINNVQHPGIDETGGDCSIDYGAHNIQFSVSGTIELTSMLPVIEQPVSIDGVGQKISLDGRDFEQIFSVDTGSLSLNDLTLMHGFARQRRRGR